MADCSICGEKMQEGSRTCSVCGSSIDDFLAAGSMTDAQASSPFETPSQSDIDLPLAPVLDEPPPMAPILDDVPAASVLDDGAPPAIMLEELTPPSEEVPPAAAIVDEPPPAPLDDPDATPMKVRSVKPPSGTPCLALYGPDKQPLQYFALEKDALLIGRLDAVAGNFPDIDLDQWFDRATIRKISRQHALILRTRATGEFMLRPLTGNTGTQLESQMLTAMQDYPLRPGHRIILGGVIRLKFEVA
jgi:hypothetical protein